MSIRCEPGDPPTLPPPVFSHELPSLIDEQDPLIDHVIALLCTRGWVARGDETWLRLCLEEAVTNAMLHGNQGDPTLKIRLDLHRDGDRWVILIADSGTGFDPCDLPDPEDPEALLREHGRGILLMDEWLDELTYYRGGSTALLARRIPEGNQE